MFSNIDFNSFKEIFGYFLSLASFVLAINERRARIRAENENKKEKEKEQYFHKLLEKSIDEKKLTDSIGNLTIEKNKLEKERSELDNSIKEEIPKLAKKSFEKYCADLYKGQLCDDYKKYKYYCNKLQKEDEEVKIPESILQEIEGLSNKNNQKETVSRAVIDIVIAIAVYLVLNSIIHIPLISELPLLMLIPPIVDIVSLYNDELTPSLDSIQKICFSIIYLVLVAGAGFLVIIFHFSAAPAFSLITDHLIPYLVIVLAILIVLCIAGINAYKNILQNISINSKTKRHKIVRIGIGIFMLLLSISVCYIFGNGFKNMLFGFNYGDSDLVLIGLTVLLLSIIVLIGEIVSHS